MIAPAGDPSEGGGRRCRSGMASLLRHPGLAQTGDIGGFEQGADLWYQLPEIFDLAQPGEARKAVVAAEPPGLGELGGKRVRFRPQTRRRRQAERGSSDAPEWRCVFVVRPRSRCSLEHVMACASAAPVRSGGAWD